MRLQAPKGTKDIFGRESCKWQYIESEIRSICKAYGVLEIRTPMFEHTELFLRSVGETTDIVQKEMYTFMDKGNRSLTLRPEGTACVARAYIENGMGSSPQPTKLYYLNPTFRYEKPQDGRQRQFHQFGVEVFGSDQPLVDAEVISLAKTLIERLGITNTQIRINSLGTAESRKGYTDVLTKFIRSKYDKLCKQCKERLEINPLRALDCKESTCTEAMKNAPMCIDYLDEDSEAHFEQLKQILSDMEIPFVVDPLIVRGLDYYTKTVFEIISEDIGTQKTICGGGRYNTMIKNFGGPDTPAIGFGLGMERLIMALDAVGVFDDNEYLSPRYYIGGIGEKGVSAACKLVYSLRKSGISAEGDLMNRSVKAQMKYADKIGAENVVIIGDNEIERGIVSVKNMKTGEQTEVSINSLYGKA